ATPQSANVSSALASVGPPAREAVERRLVDASTRASMCVGIASPQADDDAHKALVGVPPLARDAITCVDAVVHIAASDEASLAWLPRGPAAGPPGPATDCPAMTVPLGYAVTRSAPQMDGVLADAIVRLPASHAIVVAAIDPF